MAFFRMLILLLFMGCLLMIRTPAAGQGQLIQKEKLLLEMYDTILKIPSDSSRITQAAVFRDSLVAFLQLPGSFSHPFRQLKNVSMLLDSKKTFRIFTYSIPLQLGTFRYVGLIQQKRPGNPKVCILADLGKKTSGVETKVLDSMQWYGALYYQLIEKKHDNRLIYTLLGWDGNDLNSNRKVIEILTFNELEEPLFGLPIFRGGSYDSNVRIIFEFAENAVMALRYDQQYIITSKTWNAAKRGYDQKRKRASLIVFDRLVPLDERLPDDKRFHIPALDAFDGFIFTGGVWEFVTGVDVRNPAKK
ncbi:MAG: hypothetical protein FJY10_03125 [Bacteroidetes bacterium]|nr:hypothetical protein [Bacteroidota bacterium]